MRRLLACALVWLGCGDNASLPDEIAIALDAPALTIRRGETQRVAIEVTRMRGDSNIAVSVADLPSGVTADPLVVGATAGTGTLTLRASADATEGPASVNVVAAGSGTSAAAPLALVIAGTPGSPDLTFAATGKVVIDVPGATASFGRAMLAYGPDGILVAGGTEDRVVLTRVDDAGAVDPRIGNAGFVLTSAGSFATGIAIADYIRDRTIIGGGFGTPTATQFGIWTYNVAGWLDPRFGDSGTGSYSPGAGLATINTLIISPDTNLLVTGNLVAGSTTGVATRLSIHGAPDASYAVAEPGVEFDAAIVQPDGKLVVAGSASGALWLSRYATDGTRDPTFGIVATSFAPGAVRACGVVAHDGMLIAVGVTTANPHIVIARYTADGALDTTFGDGGTVSTSIAFDTHAPNAVLIDAAARLVVVGAASGLPAIARILADGTPDRTFGDGGVAALDFGIAGGTGGHAVAFEPDGRIVLTGEVGPAGGEHMVVARLWP